MEARMEEILICPVTQERLQALTGDELAQINRSIAQKELVFYDGRPVLRGLTAGYRSAKSGYAYAQEEGILYLLRKDAVVLAPAVGRGEARANLRKEKQEVKQFYDQVGWQKDEEGQYVDYQTHTDQRPFFQEYASRCYLRLKKYLRSQGTYFLDVASGPIAGADTLTLSRAFAFHVCVDLSRRALVEAKTKLGEKGIYLLADITNLPLRDESMDAVISIGTIYHVPADEQGRAFQELHRVLRPGGTAAVAYSWGNEFLPAKLMHFLNSILGKRPKALLERLWGKNLGSVPPGSGVPSLYFHAHPYSWFNRSNLGFEVQILSLSSLNQILSQLIIQPWLFGRQILRMIFALEEKFPRFFGRWGQYPLILIRK